MDNLEQKYTDSLVNQIRNLEEELEELREEHNQLFIKTLKLQGVIDYLDEKLDYGLEDDWL